MGHGDALMAAGLAQDAFEADPERRPVAICEPSTGGVRWHPIWLNNPAVWHPVLPAKPFREPYITAGISCLPYTESPFSVKRGFRWTTWRVRDHRPKVYLDKSEYENGHALLNTYGRYVVIEPTAERKHANRKPPRDFWRKLVAQLRGTIKVTFVQLAHTQAEAIPGLEQVYDGDYRQACGILASASLVVATEGGLVHAAAAMGVRTIALYGGCVSVDALGYPEHVNVVDDEPETPCGRLEPCDHCASAWRKITPERVASLVREALQ